MVKNDIVQTLLAADMEAEKRALYANMRFTMEYKREGDKWSYTVCMGKGMDKTFNFVPGEEFDSTTLDGRPIIVSILVKPERSIFLFVVLMQFNYIIKRKPSS